MNARMTPPRQHTPRRVARAAYFFGVRVATYPIQKWRKRALREAYAVGSSNGARKAFAEEADPAIVATGRTLRAQSLAANEGKHAAAGFRVLMVHPSGITADFWFGDLAQCMRHAGIDCRVLPHDAATDAINAEFESLQPNVFIAMEAPAVLQSLDLPFIQRYKREKGCLRMFIPVWRSNAPGGYPTPGHDDWRRRLRAGGLTADTYFSIFEPEFHERFSHDPSGPAVDYAPVPMACNPFTDYPIDVSKRHDYFMATSLTPERLEVSYRFLRPIVRRYQGLWAGPHWGFGTASIPPAEMPLQYASSRIALSPLVGFVHRYGAELTHRVYAAAGCGAFQLTMPTEITARYFNHNELVQAGSPEEYVRLFDHYVDRPLERNVIALAALRRAYGEHTCFHRIDRLVSCWERWRRQGLF